MNLSIYFITKMRIFLISQRISILSPRSQQRDPPRAADLKIK